jgi:FkbM family methyltransferase
MDWVTTHLQKTRLPKHVVHVGGFDGYENNWYVQWGAKTTWFEPLPNKFKELQAKGLNAYNCALGSENGTVKFHVASNLQSSSILEPTIHLEKYPNIVFKDTIDVEVKTLDFFNILDCDMLVLDVQGYELEVLKGSQKTLKTVNTIVCEVSFVELYKNCPLLKDIQNFLTEYDLKELYWVDSKEKGWADALFIKK